MSLYPLWLDTKVAIKKAAIWAHILHAPRLIPIGTTLPIKGINGRYHGDDDSSSWQTTCPVRAAVQTAAQLIHILDRAKPVIALIETTDMTIVRDVTLAAKFNHPNLKGIELGNEIDLTSTTSREFSTFLEAAYTELRNAGYTGPVISGGISRVRPDTLKYLKEALIGVAPEVMVGVHRYSIDNDANIPQAGYVNRDEECINILKVCNGRRLAITEFGYPLLDGSTQANIDKVLLNMSVDLEWFRKMGAVWAFYYQWLNGPTNTPIDRFGIENQPQIKRLLLG